MLTSDVCHKRARVRINSVKLLLVSLAISANAHGQMPAGLRWVDFKREAATVQRVEHALMAEDYTAIREIVLADEFALVMAVRRSSWQATPAEDQWLVYSVSTKNWDARKLLVGYDLRAKNWLSFRSRDKQDLGITYLDCDECEPATLFTALHYNPRDGWRARWANKENPDQPGIPVRVTDVGNPYTNEDVDQVFAVLAPKDSVAKVGTWYHSRDLTTGKLSDDVIRFFVDPSTGKDQSAVLSGSEAKAWEAQLCKATDSWSVPAMGQSSQACKQILNARRKALK